MRRLFAIAIGIVGVAHATPPPAPPTAERVGPDVICTARYAIRLAQGEAARAYSDDWWVIGTGSAEIGVRSQDIRPQIGTKAPPRRNLRLADGRSAAGQEVREYPGNAKAGWVYVLTDAGGPVSIHSRSFTGDATDEAAIARVLTGPARAMACAV